MPPAATARGSQHLRPHKLIPYLAFTLFFAIFIFKVDIVIFQKLSVARRNPESARPTLYVGNGTFNRHFVTAWGADRAQIHEDEELLILSMDRLSGSGIESKKEFMFGKIDMQIKLIPGNSAGTVTTFFLSSESEGDKHDKIVFQFLGNSSGNPYTLHTNVYVHGKGDREQQFSLWFDPTEDFHTYSILWNPKCIIFYVDDIPIRQYKNDEKSGVSYPKNQAMRVYANIFNADDWATQGGRVTTDWSLAPFKVLFRDFVADGCIWFFRRKSSSCTPADFRTKPVLTIELDRVSREKMKMLHEERMTYDYCKDTWRFPEGPSPECEIN
ncbi:Probable xyloglucan endotransglucosylase/hydrolase protein 25 [Striga hermonthica]|uniref:Xyloglucan endotransglucosylase/hydrolase n=1 Tax=Striga hermonthica TaxID=68872 RepID=A0A9N7MNN0_STRHE|nr:Probable xyloglucan endotransglucosylase/hydrolase protein 25 [Striga hermonthica]